MKPMRVWGGTISNRWQARIKGSETLRIIVMANSRAEAMRTVNQLVVRPFTAGNFAHFFSESGNNLDLALCRREDVQVWVYYDDACLKLYDAARGDGARLHWETT
jgi:hypothetical protein